MKILLWHIHGAWATAFVQGEHRYFVPVIPERSADGLGLPTTFTWPASVVEVTPEEIRAMDFDLVVIQRERDFFLFETWTGKRVGRDVPGVWVEHDCPRGDVPWTRHPIADRGGLTLVHVTHFNEVMWDCGTTPTRVIEHGVVDPGDKWTGELARSAVVSNNPLRRGRLVGSDLLTAFTPIAAIDLFGMNASALSESWGALSIGISPIDDLPQSLLHHEVSRRRLYLHLTRWTSLGLSLVEAMHLGMPVVALGTTEAWEAIPPGTGFVSTKIETLQKSVRDLMMDHPMALEVGAAARDHALKRYGLARFLADWDYLIKEVV